jgi:hypothetical protein
MSPWLQNLSRPILCSDVEVDRENEGSVHILELLVFVRSDLSLYLLRFIFLNVYKTQAVEF